MYYERRRRGLVEGGARPQAVPRGGGRAVGEAVGQTGLGLTRVYIS